MLLDVREIICGYENTIIVALSKALSDTERRARPGGKAKAFWDPVRRTSIPSKSF